MPDRLAYPEIFATLRTHLVSHAPQSTRETTNAIKQYFRNTFCLDHHVLCSHAEGNEFGIDVLVTSFDPKNMVAKRTLELRASTVRILLAVESELGGVSASSAYGVMKNVVEDYLKLLITRCDARVMIFTSLPYKGELKHVEKRVETLRELYASVAGLDTGALLIHLDGAQIRSSQVQTIISAQSIRGFIVASDGKKATEIHARSIATAAYPIV